MKKKVLVSSLLTIALCFSLIVGATFALFTSNTGVNVAVSSGKVEVVATAENITHTSVLGNTADGTYATFVEGTNTVDLKILPGDTVTFVIKVTNNSDVSIKYRTIIACEADDGLFAGLVVNVGGKEYHGTTAVSAYTTLAAGENVKEDTVKVTVSLPKEAGDEYNGKSCSFSYKVEAVQGNAETDDPDTDTVYIYSARDLAALASVVKSEGWGVTTVKTVEFLNDIDMTGVDYTTPVTVGQTIQSYLDTLTVKGNGHYIEKLNNPLFAVYGTVLNISDLTIKNSKITDNTKRLGFGAFVASAEWSKVTMTNCHAENVELTTNFDTRAAVLVGYLVGEATVTSCTVDKCSVTATGSVGGIFGHVLQNDGSTWKGQVIENCTVENSKFTVIDSGWRVGSVVGTLADKTGTHVNNCTLKNNTLVQENNTNPNHELFGRIAGGKLFVDGGEWIANGVVLNANGEYEISSADGMFWMSEQVQTNHLFFNNKTVKLTADIDLENRAWTPMGQSGTQFAGTFDGNGYTIKNLKITETVADGYLQYDGLGLFGWLGGNAGERAFVKNVVIDGAKIVGGGYAGAVAGYVQYGIVENCTVKNAEVTGNHLSANRCGGKVGAVIGFVATVDKENCKVDNCTAVDCEVSGARDAGQVVGCAYYSYGNATNLSATGVNVSATSGCTDTDAGKNINPSVIGRYIGAPEA